MKKVLVCIAIAACLVAAILINAYWWATHPDTPLNFSNPVWNFLLVKFKSETASDEVDLAFFMSSVGTVLAFLVAILIYRRYIARYRKEA
ncbi:hypothetical protein [Paraburkholderia antibiotica]|uniref:Uncharacterized protein n=1 Tax=Paraburkholderia antibiotica TaxID=2728839 RepID=A0A7X9X311_9BURK|nr:hypothetical protein [Paraburkholderia antibiotica]NML30524.1 hypothetical protein [Paraburkholderia antibiotica]